jgi:hypothetical protein
VGHVYAGSVVLVDATVVAALLDDANDGAACLTARAECDLT